MSSVYPSHSQYFKRQKLEETDGSMETETDEKITIDKYTSFSGEIRTVEEIVFKCRTPSGSSHDSSIFRFL
jgi:hypothetical protein